MTGFKLTSKPGEKLEFVDNDTGTPLEVRKILDAETGNEVFILFDSNNMLRVVQAHNDSLKKKNWKKSLKVDEEATDMGAFAKVCNAAEKTRIKSITNKVSIMGVI